jgi:transmembrane sensor
MRPNSFKLIKDYILNSNAPNASSPLPEEIAQDEEWRNMLFKAEMAYHQGRNDYTPTQEEMWVAEDELMSRISAYEQQRTHKRRTMLLRYAAVGIVLLCSTLFLLFPNPFEKQPEMVSITADAKQTVNLPDGSKVWLNRNATISYPKAFEGNVRQVRLSGEALFCVAKNPRKPFIVSSENMQARVLGTTFNFKTQNDGETEEVSLIEGKVEASGMHGEGKVVIRPNQKALFNTRTRTIEVREVYAPAEAVWHDGMIPFHKMPIGEIIKVLEQLYNVNIVIDKGLDRQQTYSGVVPHHNTVELVLDDLARSISFRYYKQGNSIVLAERI